VGQDEHDPPLCAEFVNSAAGQDGASQVLDDTALVAALAESVVALTIVKGAINDNLFQGDVHQLLVSLLRPGDLMVIDDLSSR